MRCHEITCGLMIRRLFSFFLMLVTFFRPPCGDNSIILVWWAILRQIFRMVECIFKNFQVKILRLACSYFFSKLRLGYVLKMFLFFWQSEPQRSYKHGSYSKKGVYLIIFLPFSLFTSLFQAVTGRNFSHPDDFRQSLENGRLLCE